MVTFDFERTGIVPPELSSWVDHRRDRLEAIAAFEGIAPDVGGWVDPARLCDDSTLERIAHERERLRGLGDCLVVIGVGGSNGAVRAVVQACEPREPGMDVMYAGHTLSAVELNRLLTRIDNRSVVCNVIAKNFATLEPGFSFRLLRRVLEQRFGERGAAERIVCTGTRGDSLEALARTKGYAFVEFPQTIGGRFSALSAVGLLPLAVAGYDIHALRAGAVRMMRCIRDEGIAAGAWRYACVRHMLRERGFDIEALAFFEPCLHGFGLWWRQLFGESEGKLGRGVFPALCTYSEDLHSMGQYIQEGPRRVFETFLRVRAPRHDLAVPVDASDDGFDYVGGTTVGHVNHCAEMATIDAHCGGGVPCLRLSVPCLDMESFGHLFAFCESACYASARLFEVNPFDQPGVEAYKRLMLQALGGA